MLKIYFKYFCLGAIIFFSSKLFPQDKAKIDAFGKAMFNVIRTTDTVGVTKYLPTKQDLLDYLESGKMTNEAKKDLLKRLDGGLERMHNEIYPNIIKTHSRAIEEGIKWESAKYHSTQIHYYPKGTELNFEPISIFIFFTYYGVKFKIATDCIEAKSGIFLLNKFVWRTD